ncbi:hypothetical protein [Symbioplanes lichenis]|uniref:hypothetical protein n=1 Tax=Symbioplanes lichenis TaxID=1629072 RepID=UPI0027397245|nr:hypothetical protein [Actinoplanes lichenis]
MGFSNSSTAQLQPGKHRSGNAAPHGMYASRPAVGEARVRLVATGAGRLRELAARGELAARAQGAGRAGLTGPAYDLAWPIVFSRLTRRFELQRGHAACAAGVAHLTDECLDRFHDDVEAVVEDLLTHADRPIANLDAWVASRLNAATVDAYRKQRGRRGALQRPRLPGWLAAALGHDGWLTTLATNMLVWVGTTGTAGHEVWPLESWAQERGRRTGDWVASDPAAVAREVEHVLAVMRRKPTWYESYVERPLGAKQAPVAAAPALDAYGEPAAPLPLGDPDAHVESELQRLAADAVRAIDQRLGGGEPPEQAVAEVIRTVFGGVFTGTLDRAPHGTADPLGGVTGALADRTTLDRIIATAVDIVSDPGRP